MDAAYISHSSSSEATARTWDSPCCFQYSILTTLALAALACIVLGAVAYSGVGLDEIGTTGGIALMSVGGGLWAIAGFVNCLIQIGSCKFPSQNITFDEAVICGYQLRDNQFFVYENRKGQKMVYAKAPDLDPTQAWNYSYDDYYQDFKSKYTEVSKNTHQPR